MHTLPRFKGFRSMLLLPALLAIGCASTSPPLLPAPVKPPAIPPLPAEARQPATPQLCLPSCSAGLTRERESWLALPMSAASPERPASAPMTASR